MHINISSSLFIRNAAIVLLIITIAVFVNSLLRSLIKVPRKLETRRGRTYVTIIRNIITLGILYVTLHIIFIVIGINITPLLESAGVVGIVIGIGAQSVFKDLIAGFFLLSQSTIAIGDYINVGAGIEGTVASIGLKNLTLHGRNGALIIVPNGQINSIINLTYGKANNIIDIPVKTTLSIDETLQLFRNVLTDMENSKDYTVFKESKIMGVKAIDGSGVIISAVLITPHAFRGSIEPEFYYRIIKAFEKKQIKFPS